MEECYYLFFRLAIQERCTIVEQLYKHLDGLHIIFYGFLFVHKKSIKMLRLLPLRKLIGT